MLGGWASHSANAATRRADVVEAARNRRRRTRAEVMQPIDLSADQAAVWQELAPHATVLGTLTEVSALAFRELCEVLSLKRALLLQITSEGLVVATPRGDRKAHPLLGRYQRSHQLADVALTRFGLAPIGKEMGIGKPTAEASGPEWPDPFAEFDDPKGRPS